MRRSFARELALCISFAAGCGVASSNKADLVGGRQARPGEWDSTIFWEQSDGTNCTGAIVGDHYILTAAHCIRDLTAGGTIGITSDKVVNGLRGPVDVRAVHMSPVWQDLCADRDCSFDALASVDLAILEVEPDFSRLPAFPAAVVDLVPTQLGDRVVKLGYGCEGVAVGGAPRLKFDIARLIFTSIPMTVVDGVLATPGRLFGDASICPGDSGGPLYRADATGGSDLVVGVNSQFRGGTDLRDTAFDVHTSTAGHVDWFRSILPESSLRIPYCNNDCASVNGLCEDGGSSSVSGDCELGTDCSDCGMRTNQDQQPSGGSCTDTCQWPGDGECDDGGPGFVTDYCEYGTDCTDCGPR